VRTDPLPVGASRESTPTHASLVIGLADGLGAQFGGTVQVSRLVLEGSVIKKAGSSQSELTSDVGLGYHGNRSIVGGGHRWRHDFELDQVTRRNMYPHFTLELPASVPGPHASRGIRVRAAFQTGK
jgi:hypothetical protein